MWREQTGTFPFVNFIKALTNQEFNEFFEGTDIVIARFRECAQTVATVNLSDPIHVAGLDACVQNGVLASDDRVDTILGLS